MRPTKPLNIGTLNYNIADAKQLYMNHASLIRELIKRADSMSTDIQTDRTQLERINTSNHETFIALQNEINKLKNTTSELSSNDISSKTKEALDALSATVSSLATKTDSLQNSDIMSLRTDIDTLKRTTATLSANFNVASTMNASITGIKSDVSTVSGSLNTVKSDITSISNSLSTFKSDTLASISNIESKINTLRENSNATLRQELLDILEKSIPKCREPTNLTEDASDDSFPESPTSPPIDFPFDIPQNDSTYDSLIVNGIYLTPTSKGDTQLCSINSTYGGIAIDKDQSFDRWIIERNEDKKLKFHLNTEANPPLTISKKGISTSQLTLNDRHINTIANSITDENINNSTVPTTKAIFDFVHANLLAKNGTSLLHDGQTAVENTVSGNDGVLATREVPTYYPTPRAPTHCDVSTINIGGKHSLLIHNDSCSISLKDPDTLYTMTPSSVDGLKINNSFKLANDDGILCYMSDANIPKNAKLNDLVGMWIEYTGSMKIIQASEDCEHTLYVPEVKISKDVTSVTCGLIHKFIDPNHAYTKSNRIYDIAAHMTATPPNSDDEDAGPSVPQISYHFLTISVKGIVIFKSKDTNVKCGQVMLPSAGGYTTVGSEKLNKWCLQKFIPRVKVICQESEGIYVGLLI